MPESSRNSYDVTVIRDRLNRYRETEREIENQSERLERLISKMAGDGAQVLTGMPRAPSPESDRMSDYVAQKTALEESIRTRVESQKAEREEIEAILDGVRRSDERAVIRMRYIDGESWNDVSKMLFGTKEDYESKRESYLRMTHRKHKYALVDMALVIASTRRI